MRMLLAVGTMAFLSAGFGACDSESETVRGREGDAASNPRAADGSTVTEASNERDSGTGDGSVDKDATVGTMKLTSSAFTAGGVIPAEHSCDGAGTSVPLAWSGAPSGTQTYAVVMRDLTNVNGGNNYHWMFWDIPSTVTSLAPGVPKVASPDPPGGGAKQTSWSFGAEIGYGNMCPIAGPPTHEYELVVYAIPLATLPLLGATGPNAVHARIEAEAIARGALKGTYTKQ